MTSPTQRYSADKIRQLGAAFSLEWITFNPPDVIAIFSQAAEDAARLEQMEQTARSVVEWSIRKEPLGPITDAYRCVVCGDIFHAPAVHTAHHSCPVYDLQELLSPLPSPREER